MHRGGGGNEASGASRAGQAMQRDGLNRASLRPRLVASDAFGGVDGWAKEVTGWTGDWVSGGGYEL